MSNFLKAMGFAVIVAPLIATASDAAVWSQLSRGAEAARASGGGGSVGGGGGAPNVGGGGGQFGAGRGFRRDGFRGGGGWGGGGGFRNRGYYGGFYPRSAFYGSAFYGPGFGFYDPFWSYNYGFGGYGGFGGFGGYGYYPPPRVVVREIVHPPDYLPPVEGPAPEANWYYCNEPEGYYPYVRTCNGEWQTVPAQPTSVTPQDSTTPQD